jgi:hypothetical protein
MRLTIIIKAIGYRENNIYPSIEDTIRRLHFMNARPSYRDENRRRGWRMAKFADLTLLFRRGKSR